MAELYGHTPLSAAVSNGHHAMCWARPKQDGKDGLSARLYNLVRLDAAAAAAVNVDGEEWNACLHALAAGERALKRRGAGGGARARGRFREIPLHRKSLHS